MKNKITLKEKSKKLKMKTEFPTLLKFFGCADFKNVKFQIWLLWYSSEYKSEWIISNFLLILSSKEISGKQIKQFKSPNQALINKKNTQQTSVFGSKLEQKFQKITIKDEKLGKIRWLHVPWKFVTVKYLQHILQSKSRPIISICSTPVDFSCKACASIKKKNFSSHHIWIL